MGATCSTISWTERMIRRFAGIMILVSVVLAWKVALAWLALTAFVGLNLLQSSFTNFCPLENILRRFERGSAQPEPSTER